MQKRRLAGGGSTGVDADGIPGTGMQDVQEAEAMASALLEHAIIAPDEEAEEEEEEELAAPVARAGSGTGSVGLRLLRGATRATAHTSTSSTCQRTPSTPQA